MSAVLKKTIGFSNIPLSGHRAGTMKIAPWVLVRLMSSVLLGVFKPHVPRDGGLRRPVPMLLV
mgnify:FL=1